MKYLVPFLFLLAVVAHPLQAQDAMSTDRPDFTEAPVTVGQGRFQVEAGATRQTAGDASLMTTGEGLVRYGLRPRFELRLGLPSLISGEGIDSGLSDMSVGIKWNLASLENGVETGLVASVSLPTGDDNFTSDDPNPTVILVASKPLTDKVSLASQVSSTLMKAAGDWKAYWQATAVLSAPVTEQLGAFVELRADAPPLGDNQFTFHAGFVFPVSENFQLDLHGGTGLNDAAGDEFVGLGFAFRR